jgi:hypothetical protein
MARVTMDGSSLKTRFQVQESPMFPAKRLPKGRDLVEDYSPVRSAYNRYFRPIST